MEARVREFRDLCTRFDRHRERIRTHASREFAYLVALGLIDEAALSPDDILDEAVLEAWKQRHRRPAHVSDQDWFCYTVRCAIARLARQARPVTVSLSLESVFTDPEMDDQFWAYWEPDDVNTFGDTIPDESAALVEDAALQDIEVEWVGTVLPTLPALQRNAFQLYLVDGRPLEEVAERLETSPDTVVHAAEAARMTLLEGLGRR